MSRRLPRALLAVCAAALVIATVATVLRHVTRVLGSNGIGVPAFVVTVPPGERACQAIPPAPTGTEAVRLTIGVYGDTRARLRADRGTATDGRTVAVSDGVQELPLPRAAGTDRVCITNVGSGRVELAGTPAPPEGAAVVGDAPTKGAIGVVYLTGPADRWAERTGKLFARMSYAKGVAGGAATAPVLVLLLLVTLFGALAVCWRVLSP